MLNHDTILMRDRQQYPGYNRPGLTRSVHAHDIAGIQDGAGKWIHFLFLPVVGILLCIRTQEILEPPVYPLTTRDDRK